MKKKTSAVIVLLLSLVLVFGNVVWAFQDLKGDPAATKISALQQRGVVSGIDADHFDPQGKVTFAQGIQLFVKGLHLNIDNLRFIRAPKASDYYSQVDDDAWYANALIIAQYNGITFDRNIDPNAPMTKQQFAYFLYESMLKKADIPVPAMAMVIADEQDISKNAVSSIQALLILKIAALDENNRFLPKKEITRSEASELIYNAIEFLGIPNDAQPSPTPVPTTVPTPAPASNDVSVSTEKISGEVNKVILSWGEKPNGCYQISIAKIEFSDTTATIYYNLKTPQPDMMCTQVVTNPKAETYIKSSYKIEIQQASGTEASKVN
jgi:hypothetical protein